MRQGGCAGSAVVAALISATVAVGLVVLAGCSGSDPAPIDAPTGHPGTAPPTTTASATPTQDPGPAAIAAVQRMFDAYNAMLKSGSSTAYRATFTKDCEECVNDAIAAETVFRKGQSISGGVTTVAGLAPVTTYPKLNLVAVKGSLTQKPTKIVAHGRVVDRFDAVSAVPVVWNVSLVHGRWLVSRATVLR